MCVGRSRSLFLPGQVFKAFDVWANTYVALKRIKTESEKEGKREEDIVLISALSLCCLSACRLPHHRPARS